MRYRRALPLSFFFKVSGGLCIPPPPALEKRCQDGNKFPHLNWFSHVHLVTGGQCSLVIIERRIPGQGKRRCLATALRRELTYLPNQSVTVFARHPDVRYKNIRQPFL